MLADALEAVFCPRVKAEVVEDGGQWGVVIVEGMEQVGNPDENESVLAVFSLLLHFDLADGTGEISTVGDSLEEFAANQAALTRRARRQFRIEDKLDRILVALDGTGKAEEATA